MKTKEELIKKVKDLISKDKTKEAIKLLQEEQLRDFESNLANLSARYISLYKKTSLDLIDSEVAQRKLNNINFDLFELLNQIEESGESKEAKEQPAPVKSETITKTIQEEKQPVPSKKEQKESITKTVSSSSVSTKSNSKMYLMIGLGVLLLAAGAFWFTSQSSEKEKIKEAEVARIKAEKEQAKQDSLAQVAADTETLENFNRTKKEIFLGNKFGGGTIFYIEQLGEGYKVLIAAPGDAHTKKIPWLHLSDPKDYTGADRTGLFGGKFNTRILVDIFKDTEGIYPAKLCDEYTRRGEKDTTYDDWYLPSKDELNKLYDYRKENEDFKKTFTHDYYWSSTVIKTGYVYYRSFFDGDIFEKLSTNKGKVRAIRQVEISK